MAEKKIIRIRNKATGRVAVYESEAYYDPAKKASRPKRKYLGLEDPVSGELIPSSGKRGRPPKAKDSVPSSPVGCHEPTPYDQALAAIKERDRQIHDLSSRVRNLEEQVRKYEDGLQQIARLSGNLTGMKP